MAKGPTGLQFKAVDQFIMRVTVPRDQRLVAASQILALLEQLRQEHDSTSSTS